jgi:hypothetical protein
VSSGEREEVSGAEWAGSVWPTQTQAYWIGRLGGLGLVNGPRPNVFLL